MKKLIGLLLITLLLTACGPIFGQLMKLSEGIKSFAVREGQLSTIKTGGTLLVFAPFAKSDDAFFICKGETEYAFSAEFLRTGLFQSEYYLERQPQQVAATSSWLREASAGDIRGKLQLQSAPQTILFGTLLKRETTVAPMRGVVMDEFYRLEFYDVAAKRSVIVELAVRELAEKTVATAVAELHRQLLNKH